MGCTLFMAHQEVLDVVLLVQLVVDVQYRTTRVAEDVLDTFVLQELDKDLGTAQFHFWPPLDIAKRPKV